jgi:predicted nuclease of restriction endonuclease-like (RecB) superfamily
MAHFGNGWGEKHIRHCLRIAETFQSKENFYALSRELSWTHLRTIMYLDDELKRSFYIEICRLEKWSTRTLQERINSMLYERTAISKKPDELIKKELSALKNEKKLSEDLVFRDPYILDFLELKDTYSEKDLESSILVNLQKFIGELGSDFAFLARQKRIQIDNRDYYIDLLFFHRKLKSLVAIDLKISDFDAAFKGEMELYLGYLQKYEMNEGENPPVGLILCSGKNPEHIEILQLDKSNIKVSEYLTILPPKEKLLEKLHLAVEIARNNQERNDDNMRNNEL